MVQLTFFDNAELEELQDKYLELGLKYCQIKIQNVLYEEWIKKNIGGEEWLKLKGIING